MNSANKKLDQIDSDITTNEISYLYRDSYLRLKKLLANDWVKSPNMRKEIEFQIKSLEESYKEHGNH